MGQVSDYPTKLKDPRWQRKRLEILSRDDFRCKLCNDQESTLHVHHKTYIKGREPWEYGDENFESLCEVCHAVVGYVKKHEPSELLSVIKFTHPGYIGVFLVLKDGASCVYRYENNAIESYLKFTSESFKEIVRHYNYHTKQLS